MYSVRAVVPESFVDVDFCDSFETKVAATESLIPNMGGLLFTRGESFAVSGRDAWLFVSIKNRSFTKPYMRKFVEMCETIGVDGHICIVDRPYLFNAMAELGVDVLPDSEAEKVHRVASEFQRSAQKVIRGARGSRVKLVEWRELEEQTPDIFKTELAEAFASKERIRELIFDHVSSVKPITDERHFERFADFFLCEIPVLFHTYYSESPVMDVYPGPQPRFFWRIELGQFKEELPHITKLVQGARPLLYLDTQDRRRVSQ